MGWGQANPPAHPAAAQPPAHTPPPPPTTPPPPPRRVKTNKLQFRELDTHQLPVTSLNALLKAPEFWGELEGAERVLFFQTDSLLVHGGIGEFLQVPC